MKELAAQRKTSHICAPRVWVMNVVCVVGCWRKCEGCASPTNHTVCPSQCTAQTSQGNPQAGNKSNLNVSNKDIVHMLYKRAPMTKNLWICKCGVVVLERAAAFQTSFSTLITNNKLNELPHVKRNAFVPKLCSLHNSIDTKYVAFSDGFHLLFTTSNRFVLCSVMTTELA